MRNKNKVRVKNKHLKEIGYKPSREWWCVRVTIKKEDNKNLIIEESFTWLGMLVLTLTLPVNLVYVGLQDFSWRRITAPSKTSIWTNSSRYDDYNRLYLKTLERW